MGRLRPHLLHLGKETVAVAALLHRTTRAMLVVSEAHPWESFHTLWKDPSHLGYDVRRNRTTDYGNFVYKIARLLLPREPDSDGDTVGPFPAMADAVPMV